MGNNFDSLRRKKTDTMRIQRLRPKPKQPVKNPKLCPNPKLTGNFSNF